MRRAVLALWLCPWLAACGGDDDDDTGAGDGDGDGGGSGFELGAGEGTTSLGSNYSNALPQAGLAAAVAALPNSDIEVSINEVDHNTFQENITTYLQNPDDVIPWFAGFRMRFFADQALLGDITDVWDAGLNDLLGAGFKSASTGNDGKQYFVPWTYYIWGVYYRPSLFDENGWTPPTNLDELQSLASDMQDAGITPFAFANDGNWPAMGTFDQLNFRLNGYQFHVDLMAGKERWDDERVKNVFTTWETLLPILLFGVIAGYFLWGLDPERNPRFIPSVMIAKPAPDFDLPAVAGLDTPGLASSDLRGEGPVLLNLFASWCVPCRAEHPVISRIAEEGIAPIYGLNYKDQKADAVAWLKELGNPYARIGWDLDGRAGIEWGVYGVPETYVIDKNGRIRYKHVGPFFAETLNEVIIPKIRELQAE